MIAVIPIMSRVFEMLLPMMLPKTIFGVCLDVAKRLTKSSGRDVPNETIVRPMSQLETPSFFARLEEPSTRKSAPLTNNIRPKIISK